MLRILKQLRQRRRVAMLLVLFAMLMLIPAVRSVISSPPPFDHGVTYEQGSLSLLGREERVPVYAALMSYYQSDGSGAQHLAFGWTPVEEADETLRALRSLALGYVKPDGQADGRTPTVPLPGAVWLFGASLAAVAGLRRKKIA